VIVVSKSSGPQKVPAGVELKFVGVAALCPQGTVATGGGHYQNGGTAVEVGPQYITYDGPEAVNDGVPGGWGVATITTLEGPGTTGLTVYAICVGQRPPNLDFKPPSVPTLGKLPPIAFPHRDRRGKPIIVG
jgi:hypothetical protein